MSALLNGNNIVGDARKMKAAVYHGHGEIRTEEVPVPALGPGEVLVAVRVCGLCQSDIKKVHYDLQAPPRIFGHETSGVVAGVGDGVTHLREGDRVVFHHHVPCFACRYCVTGAFSMCPTYKNVTTTAGFEPAGGGFAEFVRLPAHIAAHGIIAVPDGVGFEAASFVEPLNCVLKALDKARIQPGERVVVQGAGPMGLLFVQAINALGAFAIVTDLLDSRLERARAVGALAAFRADAAEVTSQVQALTEDYGADATMVCVPSLPAARQAFDLTRKGGRILLFAEFPPESRLELDPNIIYGREIDLIGSYSSSYKVQQLAAELIFSGRVRTEPLISHRMPLEKLGEAIEMAVNPTPETYKILIFPNGEAAR